MEIEAKPTIYDGILFKSRLEARWAVALSVFRFISKWRYEPHTYQVYGPPRPTNKRYARNPKPLPVLIDNYTPDFWIDMVGGEYDIEVKPTQPNAEYIARIQRITRARATVPIAIFYGDFYKKPVRVISFRNGIREFTTPRLLHNWLCPKLALYATCLDVKREIANAIESGKRYRFDLS